MARARRSNDKSLTHSTVEPGPSVAEGFTGKYLVLFREDGVKEGLQSLKASSGLSAVCSAADFKESVAMSEVEDSEIFVLDKLGVAVVQGDPSQMSGLQAASGEDSAILSVEPEQIMYAISEPSAFPFEYLRGYRDAVNHLYGSIVGGEAVEGELAAAAAFGDNAQFTWGLQATLASTSRWSGRGIRVAVLDTGFDLDHPDFAGRIVQSQSFVPGQTVDDLNGHGTHCIGTALGFQQRANGVRRYGCAFRGEVYAGKVLSNQGSGSDTSILAGINWAITNKCRVVSMSLGARVNPGDQPSVTYENVAQRALRSNPGTLIVAAAGNDSSRPGSVVPVSRPANCPSIMAVAALNSSLGIASFSNGGINPNGGGVDIAGPGVGVFSSGPTPFPANVQPGGPGRPWPERYHSISGTSMATPHVAGIAAMWLEARGAATTAQSLWQLLTGNARRLSLPSQDVGAGLVQAPQ